jgi:hypothetical protein
MSAHVRLRKVAGVARPEAISAKPIWANTSATPPMSPRPASTTWLGLT